MWFEILPSLAIVVVSLNMPQVLVYAANVLVRGTTYGRSLQTYDDAHHYLRDMRISGVNNVYVQKNLDCLEPEIIPEKKCECPE